MIREQKKTIILGANPDAPVLSAVLSVVQDGICFLSPDFNILYHNPAMQYWYETHNSSLQGKCYEMYHSRNTPCENCPALRAMKSGRTEEQEVLYELNSRRSGWQKVFCSPVYDENGQITMIVEYVRNITDERSAILSADLVESRNAALLDMLNQREEEQRRMEQKRMERMNQSFDSILKYLRATLDSHSFDLVSKHIELLKTSLGGSVPEEKISGQELTIARYIADGYMSKEIAEMMGLSKKTVDYHRGSIRRKLDLSPDDNLKQAVLTYFAKAGISRIG